MTSKRRTNDQIFSEILKLCVKGASKRSEPIDQAVAILRDVEMGLNIAIHSDHIKRRHSCVYQFLVYPSHMVDKIDSSGREEITWDYAVESAEHGFNGTLYLTEKYGKYNLTPDFDAKNGSSDNLGPALLQASLSMYKITQNQTYLTYARAAADSLKEHMLNDKGIIRNYSKRTGANDSDPTDANFYLLPAIADLAIYDSSYKPLAENVAYGIVRYGLSEKDIPYGAIYPNGTVADTKTGLPSNGGRQGTVSITVMGLLRAYQATDNPVFLDKGRDILLSLWKDVRTKYDLIPTTFDSVSLRTINDNTQLYATGELLKAYIYCYYLTHDPQIKNIIDDYSSATCDIYWSRATGGYTVESAGHDFNGTLYLTEKYGKYNLTPDFDAKNGSSDSLGPALLQASLSMYEITQNQTYLAYARAAADSLKEHMLNDKGIIRNYSKRTGANDSDPTDSNFFLLPAIADLAIIRSLIQAPGRECCLRNSALWTERKRHSLWGDISQRHCSRYKDRLALQWRQARHGIHNRHGSAASLPSHR